MLRIISTFIFCLLLLEFSNAHPGIGIVMDQAGNVFYTDLIHVWKIAPNGKRTIAVKNVHTHELYLDANGDLYGEHEWYEGEATDKWGNYVWCLSKDGVLEKYIPDVEGFLDNTTLVRDHQGNSYWARKSEEGEILMKQSKNGANNEFTTHSFDDIRWMHYSRYDNHLYVVDNLIVKKVSPNGEVRSVVTNLKVDDPPFAGVGDHHYVYGIWTDTEKNVFVAVFGARQVIQIDKEGVHSTAYKSPKDWSPCGGLVDKNGTMWIMEFSELSETRVRKIVPEGKDIIYGG